MHATKPPFTAEQLISEIFGCRSEDFVALDPAQASALAGLQELLRRSLERAMSMLWPREIESFQFVSDASAAALTDAGWPSAATHNLAELFAHALIFTTRLARHERTVPLRVRVEAVAKLPRATGEPLLLSDLIATALAVLEVDTGRERFAPENATSSETMDCLLELLVRASATSPSRAGMLAHVRGGTVCDTLATLILDCLGKAQAIRAGAMVDAEGSAIEHLACRVTAAEGWGSAASALIVDALAYQGSARLT